MKFDPTKWFAKPTDEQITEAENSLYRYEKLKLMMETEGATIYFQTLRDKIVSNDTIRGIKADDIRYQQGFLDGLTEAIKVIDEFQRKAQESERVLAKKE